MTRAHLYILHAVSLDVSTVPDLMAISGWSQAYVHELISDLCRWGKVKIAGIEGRRYRYALTSAAPRRGKGAIP